MILERGNLLNNRYRIVEILGQGGMGSVYRAIDENLGVEVAVKDNLFTTDEYARQFRREAIILANLRHPNLPRVTDHFVITGQGQYLVMDYIEGEDLRQRMDRVGIIPEEEAIIIGAAVCDALAYLSSREPSIIHRDIKPGNIRITPQGHIFLVDFGLAKALQGTQATTTGARAMTPGYSPPEQYGTARTDQRSDIFSLGATLYAALTGATPEDALSRAMDQSELTSIRKHTPRVSKRVSAVIEKALEVRPDDRYQTAEDFKQALLSVSANVRRKEGDYSVPPPPEEGKPGTEGSPSSAPDGVEENFASLGDQSPELLPVGASLDGLQDSRAISRSRPQKRRRRSCLLFLIAFILLVGGGGVVAYVIDPGLAARAMGQLQPIVNAVVATPTSEDVSLTAFVFTPTWTLPLLTDTPMIADTATPTETSTATPEPTDTPIPTDTATPMPTPQGGGAGQIAYASDITGIYQIYMINVDGTGKKQITDIPEGACQPSWSPTGKRLVFVSPCDGDRDYYPESALYIINVDGSGMLPLPASFGGDYDPSWSPVDDNLMAFISLRNSGRPQIYVINLEDNSVIGLSDEYDFSSQPKWSPDGKRIMYVSTSKGRPILWVMDADGSNKQPFSHNNLINASPAWSPDGQMILFTQLTAEGGIPRLVRAPFDLENYLEFRVTTETIPMREGVYSPDGYWIAFEGWEAGGRSHDIFVIASTGAGRRAVTVEPRWDIDPDWRPTVIE